MGGRELAAAAKLEPGGALVDLGGVQFGSRIVDLAPGTQPPVHAILQRSLDDKLAAFASLRRFLIVLAVTSVIVSILLAGWLGWQWIEAAEHKIVDPAWVSGGEALKAYWERALAIGPNGKSAIAFDWYRGFIQVLYDNQTWTWFAPLIAWSELLIGVALILGAFTGLAAFGGSLLNWSFVMAGTASTNMLLFAVAALVILAWKVAGWYGLDRWLLPALGTPWRPGRLLRESDGQGAVSGHRPRADEQPRIA